MDNKDINNQGNNHNGHAVNDIAMGSFYDKNNRMSFILKKTEKIVTAIYMVTDFVSESEPLRIELRTLAILLLSKTRKLSTKASEPEYIIIDDIKNATNDIFSFLDLAVTIGIISNMNGNILRSELDKNIKKLDELYSEKKMSCSTHPGYSNIILSEELFRVSLPEPHISLVSDNGHVDKGLEKENTVLYNKPVKQELKTEYSLKTNNLGIKIARRNDVLNIVKVKGQVSVKDIILMLKDVSEKTIQRELLSLVKEGVLKKEGEKRWSVYKLR